jgi:hypothetical protein
MGDGGEEEIGQGARDEGEREEKVAREQQRLRHRGRRPRWWILDRVEIENDGWGRRGMRGGGGRPSTLPVQGGGRNHRTALFFFPSRLCFC